MKQSLQTAAVLAAAVLCLPGCAARAPREPVTGLPLVASFDFEDASLAGWRFTDPAAWEIVDGALALTGASAYEPAVRSPRNIAWIDGARVGDFVLEADVLYTGRDYGHADLCFFLGGTTPSQFYYAHVAHDADPNANSVFIVNDADRTGIALERSGGQPWGSDWRKVRVQRIGPAISVFLDGERVMHANDATHGAGEVGLGSFDDTGRFDNIRLHGEVLR